ncbi:MAG: AmpG family muropeptide MFS transporter [Calditrichaeota bacterium]|nr:AmpG family muropeptide MFS transporter [Calditrichota bacterium]
MQKKTRSPWLWVPSIYFAEGIPYVVVMMVSVIMYKRLGVSNADIALYTSWLYLPWVIKPLWSPVVDLVKTKRFWILTMQLFIGAGLAGIALSIPLPTFFKFTLIFFWLLAFSSATHDIAADGFYMLGLTEYQQAWFVGVRSTFYRFAMITGQGLLIILAGYLESNTGLESVKLNVIADPDVAVVQPFHPDSIRIQPQPGELRILHYPPENLKIAAVPRDRQYVDSVLNLVREWNVKNGFSRPDKYHTIKPKSEESWWHNNVAGPIGEWIKQNFGEEKKLSDSRFTGNIGLIYFYLSDKPEKDEEVVINFGRTSGDKSVFLLEGSAYGGRITFNDQNWTKPALAVIQLDPKLKHKSAATFTATAGNIPLAWSLTFFFLTGMFVLFFLYHKFILPYPDSDRPGLTTGAANILREFINTFVLFFKKEKIGYILAFLLLYRLAESQLVKLASPFLLDAQEAGGLALTTGQVGFVYGTVGILFLTLGGLLGGFLAAKHGLKYWLLPMAVAINLPDVVYVYLSYVQPDNLWIVNLCVAIEQFGYGFGFTAYMLYMIYASQGEHKTAHFAITTGFMALGMMIPGMFSGWVQELIGYHHFFIWVMIATIPGFLILPFIPLEKDFGKKNE